MAESFRLTDRRHHRRLDQRIYRGVFARSHRLAQRISSRGVVLDNSLLYTTWGVTIEEIAEQLRALDPPLPITIWQGAADASINVEGTRALAETLPDCTLIYDPFASHLEILLDQTDSIVRTLCRPRPPTLPTARRSHDVALDGPAG